MPIIERIRLNILSREELRQLENDIMKLEQLAKRKQIAQEKISVITRKKGVTVGATGSRGPSGTIFGELPKEALPSALLKKKAKTLTDRKADADVANLAKAKDKTSAQAVKKTPPFQDVLSRLDKIEETGEKFQQQIQKFTQLESDPIGFLVGILTKNRVAAKLFGAIAVITIVAKIVETKVRELFGPGGALDIRKIVRDAAKTIPELAFLLDVRAGRTFFSADTRVISGLQVIGISDNLGDKDLRYRELLIGRGLLS